ncbi:Lrp/AsnC family transcriptional regulator [Paenibacillus sp. FSL H8-0317]|uniref:Lrp/AsnC family transcriptional regulator n=1 Tax=unclassified Paenibacillus TaxID=185978 RepID=UPI0030CD635F
MLDNTDRRILDELSNNSRVTMKELGTKIHMTGQATASRVAKLEDNGVIEGYTIKVNQAKLNCYIHAFITIFTKETNHQFYLSFIKTQMNYIINNYRISGEGCYMLECRFPSNEYLNDFLVDLNKHANYKLSTVINKMDI